MKKFFTFIAVAALTLSANAKVLWTGSCTFANYTTEDERPVFQAGEFAEAAIGDKLVFSVTDNAADPQSWHQLELYNQDITKALTKGVQITPETTEVVYTLDNSLLGRLQEGGFALAGTGYIVTEIAIESFNGIIWEGECLVPDWTPQPPVNLAGSMFASAAVGDNLIFTVEKINPEEYACLQVDRGTTYSAGAFGATELTEAAQDIVFTLTDALISELTTYGINITGMNVKLTAIKLTKGGGNGDDDNTEALWTGAMTTGDWSNYLELEPEIFEGITAGDILRFTVTAVGDDGSLCLKQRLADGWQEMPSDTEWGNYLNLTEGDGTYSFTVNAAAAETIAANGLVAAGSNYTLTKVALVKSESDAINQIANANAAADAAIYNLQGRRVAVATKGIYIIGGKKVLVK